MRTSGPKARVQVDRKDVHGQKSELIKEVKKKNDAKTVEKLGEVKKKSDAKTIEKIGEALIAMTNGSLKTSATMAGITSHAGNRSKV